MRIKYSAIFIFLLLINNLIISGQQTGTFYGTVYDTSGYSVGFATLLIPNTKYGAIADRSGRFEIKLPAGRYTIQISSVGYKTLQITDSIGPGERKQLDVVLTEWIENVDEVKISARADNTGAIQRVNVKSLQAMPNVSGNIESIIKRLPGVASNNELSSQYSVRGGSFDENIIYVNNIEIYRPVLIRSGQQEGLSFVNPDLVGSLKFSAGGFDVSYGDKMSSVLDVTYKRPDENSGSATLSFLGANVHYEGVSENQRFRHLTGIRYKTTQYLLSGLDTKGEYKPTFLDAQSFLTYNISTKWELDFLGYIAQNNYVFAPTTREIEFGTFQLPLRAQIFYEGQEEDSYFNSLGAVTLNFRPNVNSWYKLITSAYTNSEKETFDLLGEYNIGQIDYNNRDSVEKIGVGGFLNHARNFLNSYSYNIQFIGFNSIGLNKIRYGISYQHEKIDDRLREWEIIDSAGYLHPYNDTQIQTLALRNAENYIKSYRIMGYVLYTRAFSIGNESLTLNAGIRSHFWSFNNQNIINPRASLSYQPSWKKGLLLYTSVGYYQQPPSYKEMRYPTGEINKQIKAQKAVNYLIGADYLFYSWSHPFKLTVEAFYKQLSNLIPYRIDNVRSIYAGENLSKGYARGIDIKLNGEFIKGTESWFSLSLLDTKEDIPNDFYALPSNPDSLIYPGYFSRPTDQLMNLNIYFQDYLPRYPSYKVYLSIHYGSALPVTIPFSNRWDDVKKLLPSYKRVDIGFSKIIKSANEKANWNLVNQFKEVWLSAEILNVIGVNNTASYMWIKTFAQQEGIPGTFAVPNYLTPRRLNIKLMVTF
ncbi:MAG: TonB-dependent receptor [Bacteroidales bacterium]|nr:TonB-dependent receptor [Bacteroidales bacterium]